MKPWVSAFKKVMLVVLMLSATVFSGVIIYWTAWCVMDLWLVHPSVVLFTGTMIAAAVAGVALELTRWLE